MSSEEQGGGEAGSPEGYSMGRLHIFFHFVGSSLGTCSKREGTKNKENGVGAAPHLSAFILHS